MHWHSANETHTVIRGNWTFEHEGMRDELGLAAQLNGQDAPQAWASMTRWSSSRLIPHGISIGWLSAD